MKEETKIYFCDIDNTICKTKGEDYKNAEPNWKRIKIMNELYDNGNEIVYLTSRGAKSGKDWEDFTRYQLDSWGCKYGYICFKGFYDFIIDDRAISPEEFFL